MAPHSSTLAWKIPWTEEPGGLQSMESLRVGHDSETSLSLFTFMHWRRKWQPTPVFLPGESQGRGSLVGCRLWGCTESDTTEATQQQQQQQQDKIAKGSFICKSTVFPQETMFNNKKRQVGGVFLNSVLQSVLHRRYTRFLWYLLGQISQTAAGQA